MFPNLKANVSSSLGQFHGYFISGEKFDFYKWQVGELHYGKCEIQQSFSLQEAKSLFFSSTRGHSEILLVGRLLM